MTILQASKEGAKNQFVEEEKVVEKYKTIILAKNETSDITQTPIQ